MQAVRTSRTVSTSYRQFFERLAKKLAIHDHEDWYTVTRQEILRNGGGSMLINHFNNSHIKAITSTYPEIEWQPWKFVDLPSGFWNDKKQHNHFIEWLQEQLDIKSEEDWYRVSHAQVIRCGGANLLKHAGPLSTILKSVFPSVIWQPWRFASLPTGFWEDAQNQREFVEWLGTRLGIQHPSEWQYVTSTDFAQYGGSKFLECYHGSVAKLIASLNMQTNARGKHGIKNSLEHQRQFLDWVAGKRGVLQPSDWYKITVNELIQQGGSEILERYGGSLYKTLSSIYPEVAWQPWQFAQLPRGFWNDRANQKNFLDWVGKDLGLTAVEDWAMISSQDVIERGGAPLLKYYNNSMQSLIEGVYGNIQLQRKKTGMPAGYWIDKEHQGEFLEWLKKKLDIKHDEDWYGVKNSDIIEHGGGMILKHCGSLCNLLNTHFPQGNWLPWLFNLPDSYWDNAESQRKYLDWLAHRLGKSGPSDWYSVEAADIRSSGGRGLLDKFQGSMYRMLKQVYGYQLAPWKFANFHSSSWSTREHQQEMLEYLSWKLEIREWKDWYGVTQQQIALLGAGRFLSQYEGSLLHILQTHFPDHDWQWTEWKLQSHSKAQQFLLMTLKNFIPSNLEIEINAIPLLKYSHSGAPMQLDIWIPSLNLALEYQGIQHYVDNIFMHNEEGLEHRCILDRKKRTTLTDNGILTVDIPFWWQGTKEEIVATISNVIIDFGNNLPP